MSNLHSCKLGDVVKFGNGKALLMGILLYVATDEDEADNRTMGRVRDIISMGSKELNHILTIMGCNDNHIISSAGIRTLSKEENYKVVSWLLFNHIPIFWIVRVFEKAFRGRILILRRSKQSRQPSILSSLLTGLALLAGGSAS